MTVYISLKIPIKLLIFHIPIIAISCATPDIWHPRPGHQSISRLSALKDVLSLYSSMLNKTRSCEICSLAKQKQLSFESHNNRTSINFDMIHADVWSPFSTHSQGYKYFLTVVHDHCRYTWVFLMRNKSDVLKIVSQFFAYVETQYNKTIKVFRSDNAPELSFTQFFLQEGAIHQFSCVGRLL